MKKVLLSLAIAILSLVFTQCQKESVFETSIPEPAEGEIRIRFTSEKAGKASFYEPAEGDPTFKWEADDQIFVYDGNQYCGALTLNPDDAGKETGEFIGNVKSFTGDKVYFYYFGPEVKPANPENGLTLDISGQNAHTGSSEWGIKNFISTYSEEQSAGKTEFSGEMKGAFAIGRFTFVVEDFVAGQSVSARGLAKTVKLSSTGILSYEKPAGDDEEFTQFEYSSDNLYYIAMPSGDGREHLRFINLTTNKFKSFEKSIENGVFYRGPNVHLEDTGMKIYYATNYPTEPATAFANKHKKSAEDNNLTASPAPADEFAEYDIAKTQNSHNIIKEEPDKEQYNFQGWATERDAVSAEYIKADRAEGTTIKSTVNTTDKSKDIYLYGVWGNNGDYPYVDYERREISGVFKLKYISGWIFNKRVEFDGWTGTGYEHINFPVRKLNPGTWYYLVFGEHMSRSSAKNWWNADRGVYACAVRSNKELSTDFRTMMTYTTGGDADQYVFVHSEGDWSNAPYVATDCDTILFKATAETMYWIWDLSKQNDTALISYEFDEPGETPQERVFPVPDVTGPTVYFRDAKLNNFRVKSMSSDRGSDDGGNHLWAAGFASYKAVSVDNDYLRVHTVGLNRNTTQKGYGKLNIPIINLQPNTKYKLTFTYKRVDTEDPTYKIEDKYDFCCGIVSEPNTDDTNTHYHSTGTYTANFTENQLEFEKTLEFETGENQTTAYWVWSMSGLKPCRRNIHEIKVKTLEVVTE